MITKSTRLLIATLFVTLASTAQQSPSPTTTTQSAQLQAAPLPCTSAPSSTNATNAGSIIKPTDKTQQAIAKERRRLSDMLGIDIPDPTQLAKLKKPLQPCPPAKAETPTAPAPKAPADATVTMRCNPLITLPKGVSGASTGFTLPDLHQYGVPGQANAFEADSAVPDLNAKTPCYALKVDPKTNKYFIAQ